MSKKQEPKERVILGRLTNHLRMGIVGLPNVGKSTLFNALTKCQVQAQNYPFCTIDPNQARVAVPDERFDYLCEHYKPASKVAASLQVTDIAGLVKGAAAGEGLGNAFLSHISGVDGIYQVVRVFEDEDIVHVEGDINPVRDMEIILNELCLKDEEIISAKVETLTKQNVHKKDKVVIEEIACLNKCLDMVKQKRPIRFNEWTDEEAGFINNVLPLTAKPMIYLVNMSENDFLRKRNKYLMKIKNWIEEKCKPFPTDPIIPYSGAIVAKEIDAALAKTANQSSEPEILAAGALAKIVNTGYTTLNLIHFFTAGHDEVKCWTVRKGTKAPQAAGTIHSDFEKGFVCAEVMTFDDFKQYGSEQEVKLQGKYRQEGRNYQVCDGDIMFFRANTSGLGKKR
ncbi:GTP-binding protein YchF, putative [Entamoeba histolytica HM-1:IMSS-B]|uniref:Obg-like ATPase 1 n=5 Tax=Entamoeba histolytica TaxID=5759 RepID=C4LSZ7_ENTH1|nr:GTP-binding protein, putative [Entamoeba histolytica HM-1:IMSS]EMD48435.1 GTP-binding protein, putative [Entamoeba histolytica KU27]EMH77110.1 GTP-binding protein YchF, putative [Entamoeba histolytica HM-1:IMSS-B]ENY61633.1 GTP-binding protein, putative [Entamoeba histolytica HM-1:IMSS-A]GAT91665.1 GTP-binding protein putative [Entamoeba histolytica]EAL52123.1 GTP-binding protein, putative [Entamoeba histolytica HM-1:IMSS]|eukprot:XP_657513.1 GTP-binding protein, putative [Entamoeba histolytica HM-1:IMSS]